MACLTTLKMDYNWWLDEVLPLTPPHFPEIRIRIHRRRYPEGLPFDMEAKILGVEAMEAEVKDPGLVFRWAALRAGRSVPWSPRVMLVNSWGDRSEVTYMF